MKVVRGVVVATVALCIASGAYASSIAVKVWNAEIDTAEDPALHVGVAGSLGLSDSIRLSGQILMGTFESVGADDTVQFAGFDIDSSDADLILIYRANIVDVGLGGRYTEWGDRGGDSEDNFKIFGPSVYLGLGNSFGDTPFGWYVGGSYMVKDFGDAYDNDDFDVTYEHYNVEAGLSISAGSLVATVGYRIKEYTDSDIDLTFDGVAGSLGFGF